VPFLSFLLFLFFGLVALLLICGFFVSSFLAFFFLF